MSIWKTTASDKKGDGDGKKFEKAPEGSHVAVLVAIVDMGTQKDEYGGEVNWRRKAYFVWELVNEKMSGFKDRNHLIGIDLNLGKDGKMNEKLKLRTWIEARVGKTMPDGAAYDISQELGKPCTLTVKNNKKGYPVIANVTALIKGTVVPPTQNKTCLWSLEDYEQEGTIDLPEWVNGLWLYGEPVTTHIMRCQEITNPNGGGGDEEDDVKKFSQEGTAAEEAPF